MQMSTEYGFAFLCMPKCASTSIEKAIKKFCNINFSGHPSIKHINAEVYTKYILPMHQQLRPSVRIESFCLMRDPLEWIESWYRYRSRKAIKNPNHKHHRNYTGNISYQEFIEEYISEGKRKPFAKLRTQFRFLSLENNQIGVDYIFPMNRMDLAADLISEKVGRRIRIPTKNVSPKKKVSLDSDVERRLRKHLSKDILIYQFIEENGTFNKALHADKVAAILELDP